MKSPYQLEALEKTYAMESYPSEALRAELSAKIGLSDRHPQIWFCHRRLKDRKVLPTKQQRREESPAAASAAAVPVPAGERIYRKSQREKRRPTPTPKPMPTSGLIRTLVFLGGALSGTLVKTALTARHATKEASMDTATLQFFSKLQRGMGEFGEYDVDQANMSKHKDRYIIYGAFENVQDCNLHAVVHERGEEGRHMGIWHKFGVD